MKASIWNILTILLSVGVVIMAVLFGVVFLMPNQVLPVAMRPISLPPTLALPTSTETPLVYFPPTWTKTPLATTAAPTATKTYTLTVAVFPTETEAAVLSQTATATSTTTATLTKTSTKSAAIIIVNGTARTATKTKTVKPTKTPTKKPTITPGGPPLFGATDDYADVGVAPSSVIINVIANDYHFPDLPIRIATFIKYPKHGTIEKVSKTDVKYRPDAGFVGLDTFVYKMTDEPGSVDEATVYIIVGGALEWPTAITLTGDTIAENTPVGADIGILSTSDLDSTSFSYKLIAGTGDTNNSLFTLSGDGRLKAKAMYDFEKTPVLSIRVRSTDDTGLFVDERLLVYVTNVNEAPSITTMTLPNAVVGNEYNGLVKATDPDSGDTLTFSCVTGPAWLTCNADGSLTGTVAGSTGPVTFTARVQDAGGLYDVEPGSITVVQPTPTQTPSPTPE